MNLYINHADVASIAICICTRQRPIMLGKCLKELTNMIKYKKCRLEILIIENNVTPQCKEITDWYNNYSNINIHYFLEDNIGISPARNRSIEEALKLGTEWIAFIDDDAYPDKCWLDAYLNCVKKYPADVYDGLCVMVYPENTPDYLREQPHKGIEGDYLKYASTGNVLFHRNIADANGLNMRFRNDFKFSGGEDYELFRRASSLGVIIRRCTGAIVYEGVTSNRATLAWNLARRYHFGQVHVFVSKLHNGILFTLFRKSILGILKILGGVVGLPLFPLWPISILVRRHVFKSMCRMATGVGIFAGLLNISNQQYIHTDGI